MNINLLSKMTQDSMRAERKHDAKPKYVVWWYEIDSLSGNTKRVCRDALTRREAHKIMQERRRAEPGRKVSCSSIKMKFVSDAALELDEALKTLRASQPAEKK
jgi:hypothetical protein